MQEKLTELCRLMSNTLNEYCKKNEMNHLDLIIVHKPLEVTDSSLLKHEYLHKFIISTVTEPEKIVTAEG